MSWRDDEASFKQTDLLKALGFKVPPKTKGECSDLIGKTLIDRDLRLEGKLIISNKTGEVINKPRQVRAYAKNLNEILFDDQMDALEESILLDEMCDDESF